MRWARNVARTGYKINAYRLLGEAREKDRDELSYLAPLGSENVSASYFKQCFFKGGHYPPPTESNTTPPSPKTSLFLCL